MTGEQIYPLEFKLPPWIIVIFLLLGCAVVLWRKNRKISKDFKMHRHFNITWSIFFLCYGIGRIFFSLSDYERAYYGTSAFHYQLVTYAYVCGVAGIASAIYYFDKYIFKPDRLFVSKTLLACTLILLPILVVVAIFYNDLFPLIRIVVYSSLFAGGGFLAIGTLRILRAVDTATFSNYLWNVIGLLLMIIGISIDIEPMYNLVYFDYPYLLVLSPIILSIGAILFTKNIDILFKLMLEFYESQQICLVHRGKLKGRRHMCPNCFVKYCDHCFKAVIMVEKKCWACNSYISKEVKAIPSTPESPEQPEKVAFSGEGENGSYLITDKHKNK